MFSIDNELRTLIEQVHALHRYVAVHDVARNEVLLDELACRITALKYACKEVKK